MQLFQIHWNLGSWISSNPQIPQNQHLKKKKKVKAAVIWSIWSNFHIFYHPFSIYIAMPCNISFFSFAKLLSFFIRPLFCASIFNFRWRLYVNSTLVDLLGSFIPHHKLLCCVKWTTFGDLWYIICKPYQFDGRDSEVKELFISGVWARLSTTVRESRIDKSLNTSGWKTE